jgi:hypothetical protein
MVIVPPYVGAPRLSHQFPVTAVVVEGVVVIAAVVIGAVLVVALMVVVVGGGLDVDVVVDVLQDTSNIATPNKILKPNQINFLFNSYSFLLLNFFFL